ncbi:MAG: aspartate--ammonia ligase, partial [Clostridia bacterium]|nr:aspartate--ammonia ligase [Clostridia bacterium]
ADAVAERFPQLALDLPTQIQFITTLELEEQYPALPPKERENAVAREYGAVFIMKIGGKLRNGEKHDGRAPDYDDWDLNGDIVVYNPVIDRAFELSSMGIRVDRESLLRQLRAENAEDRLQFEFHKLLLEGALPLTVGGGIGQSRLCMYLLKKAHIGEVQVSVWPQRERDKCERQGIHLM